MHTHTHLCTPAHIPSYSQTPHTYTHTHAFNLINHMKLHVNRPTQKRPGKKKIEKGRTRVRWGDQQSKKSRNIFLGLDDKGPSNCKYVCVILWIVMTSQVIVNKTMNSREEQEKSRVQCLYYFFISLVISSATQADFLVRWLPQRTLVPSFFYLPFSLSFFHHFSIYV